MNLQPHKYHNCERCSGEGILLVDLETESFPRADESGNWQYYCFKGHIFAIPAPDTASCTHDELALETFYRRQ